MNIFEDLNPQQQQAVMANTGAVLVMAGPGSGKTRVLTQRIVYLIEVVGTRPYNIMAVTFTNKAAREMAGRIYQKLGEERARGVTLGTFHAVCARILRKEAEYLPFDSNFVIFDSDDQVNLVKRALEDFNIDDKRYAPVGVHAAISNAKNELVLPDDYPVQNYRDEVVSRIYRRYGELLLANNALDFDDLLLWTALLLEENPAVCEKYARRYEHLLVDEFQDTNLAQYSLLKHLASFHGNLFVVGDADQSIYRWRGADYRNVLRFEKDFPAAQVILLEQNYRSTQSILDLAMAIIDRHPYRMPKRLFTDRGEGENNILFEAYDDRAEAEYVVENIARLVATKNAGLGDFAVMYRTNAQSRLLEEAFLRIGLPYKLVGAQRFYGRREVKDVIACLRLALNPNDDISLTRVINVPPRGIGNKTLLALRIKAKALGLTPGELLLRLGKRDHSAAEGLFNTREATTLSAFAFKLVGWHTCREELTPLRLMDRILTDIDYHSYIDDGSDEGRDRWENVMELRRLASEYNESGLEAFLEQVALVSDQDTITEETNAPTLLTLHAAKGLEFPVVFIVGLNDGILPHNRSFEDAEGMQEERRLLYVGITRAKDRLHLVYSQYRNIYGYLEPVDPSRFLGDISLEKSHIQGEAAVGVDKGERSQHPGRWRNQDDHVAHAIEARFHPGTRVNHPVWGEGLVLNSALQEDDEIVDIFFQGVGLKRVVASLAKLEVVTN